MPFQFHIQLYDVMDPIVWRRIMVPEDYSFYHLHAIIQVAFGWENSHLFEFSPGNGSKPTIGIPHPDMKGTKDARKVLLPEVFKEAGQLFIYTYDFGDSWEHVITLEEISKDPLTKAACTGGEGACPPEDCGGMPGYENFKAIMKDPKHPEYEEMKDWLGMTKKQKWDPHKFDLKRINLAVGKI